MWSETGLKWPEYRYNFDNRTRWWNDLFENDFHEKEFPQTHHLDDKNRAICLLLLCFRFECGFIKFKSVQIKTKREMPRFIIDIPFSWICVLYLFGLSAAPRTPLILWVNQRMSDTTRIYNNHNNNNKLYVAESTALDSGKIIFYYYCLSM